MDASGDMARFETALPDAQLALDARDKAAALRVFLALEKAAALLKADTDAPR